MSYEQVNHAASQRHPDSGASWPLAGYASRSRCRAASVASFDATPFGKHLLSERESAPFLDRSGGAVHNEALQGVSTIMDGVLAVSGGPVVPSAQPSAVTSDVGRDSCYPMSSRRCLSMRALRSWKADARAVTTSADSEALSVGVVAEP